MLRFKSNNGHFVLSSDFSIGNWQSMRLRTRARLRLQSPVRQPWRPKCKNDSQKMVVALERSNVENLIILAFLILFPWLSSSHEKVLRLSSLWFLWWDLVLRKTCCASFFLPGLSWTFSSIRHNTCTYLFIPVIKLTYRFKIFLNSEDIPNEKELLNDDGYLANYFWQSKKSCWQNGERFLHFR